MMLTKLWNIFLAHNRPWTQREAVVFLILLFLVSSVLVYGVRQKRLSLRQAAASLVLFLFLALVFASTVFTRMTAQRSYEPVSYTHLAGIDERSLLQAVDTAVQMNAEDDFGIPVPDYVEENVSTKVVKIIQSYTGVVDKMVWRKNN